MQVGGSSSSGAPYPGAAAGGADQMVSHVGELPKFDKPKGRGGGDDTSSEISQGSANLSGISDMVDNVNSKEAKEQRAQAKIVVKDFVKSMVKGRKMNVIAPDGNLKSCSVSLNRDLDMLRIKVKSNSRSIPLREIEEIHAGEDPGELNIQTPLDELSATLMLPSEETITFRMNDVNDRDTFVMCLLMFCNNQK